MATNPHICEKSSLSFHNKIILAPMVKVGTLPMRLLALKYGADLVYCEELIDWKFLRSKRFANEVLGTVDYIDETDGSIIFRTCKEESKYVVLQIGTCDPQRVLSVAKLVQDDIAAIDVNMGCPKEFSIKGGMGAALLTQPDKVRSILTTLVDNLNIPVTCKIRVLKDEEETISLCKMIEQCGVSAIAVHARTKYERPQHPNRNELIKKISLVLSIPVIANGGSRDIRSRKDIVQFQQDTGASSVMIARAAEWNCSVFRKDGPLDVDDVIKEYLNLSVKWDGAFANAKYCVQMMLRDRQESPFGKKFLNTQTMNQLCSLWNIDAGHHSSCLADNMGPLMKRSRVETYWEPTDDKTLLCDYRFVRNHFDDYLLPKTHLYRLSHKNRERHPKYITEQKDKLFHSVVTYAGNSYASRVWEKNKRYAEQSAAMSCLSCLGLCEAKSESWMPGEDDYKRKNKEGKDCEKESVIIKGEES